MNDLADFDWPCGRRDAHHAHFIPGSDEEGDTRTCPGVPAHPTTMIGGQYR